MTTLIRATLAALSLASAPALAGEGGSEPFTYAAHDPAVAQQVLNDTGSEGMPVFGRSIAVVEGGGLTLPSAANAPVQTANSLPTRSHGGTSPTLEPSPAWQHFAALRPAGHVDGIKR